jgi:hypothetical protein
MKLLTLQNAHNLVKKLWIVVLVSFALFALLHLIFSFNISGIVSLFFHTFLFKMYYEIIQVRLNQAKLNDEIAKTSEKILNSPNYDEIEKLTISISQKTLGFHFLFQLVIWISNIFVFFGLQKYTLFTEYQIFLLVLLIDFIVIDYLGMKLLDKMFCKSLREDINKLKNMIK